MQKTRAAIIKPAACNGGMRLQTITPCTRKKSVRLRQNRAGRIPAKGAGGDNKTRRMQWWHAATNDNFVRPLWAGRARCALTSRLGTRKNRTAGIALRYGLPVQKRRTRRAYVALLPPHGGPGDDEAFLCGQSFMPLARLCLSPLSGKRSYL